MSDKEVVENKSYPQIIDHVLNDMYPKLFGYIYSISSLINDSRNLIETGLLNTSIEHLNKTLDELYRKEKLVMFPFMLDVVRSDKTLNISSFDWVAAKHKDILTQLKTHKELAVRVTVDVPGGQPILQEINRFVNEFEDMFLYMQVMVEDKLIGKICVNNY